MAASAFVVDGDRIRPRDVGVEFAWGPSAGIVEVWDAARTCLGLVHSGLVPDPYNEQRRAEICAVLNQAWEGAPLESCIAQLRQIEQDLLRDRLSVRRRAFHLGLKEVALTLLLALVLLGVYQVIRSLQLVDVENLEVAVLWNKVENVTGATGAALAGFGCALLVRRHAMAMHAEYRRALDFTLAGDAAMIRAIGNLAVTFLFVLSLLFGASVLGINFGSLSNLARPLTAFGPGLILGLTADRLLRGLAKGG
ncbi:hypothetical protein LCL97_12545 [Seohaeicola saemankumensis]|nr:hypothetical protein [Seohaeicola saemankumensis]MCA0871659.1 hypothetical protein [Seohaeicola saemankumensis]